MSLGFYLKEIPELEKHCKDLGKVMQEASISTTFRYFEHLSFR